MPQENSPRESELDDIRLPEELVKSIRESVRPKDQIDSDVDNAILLAARRHLDTFSVQPVSKSDQPSQNVPTNTNWTSTKWVSIAATLAASVLLIIGLRPFWATPGPDIDAIDLVTVPEDVNQSGKVDILDALLLAQKVKRGGPLDDRWDLNQDGQVNQSDVARIAQQSVQLNHAERKG